MYDPVTARFLQADTYLGNLNAPLSLNLYTYCLNNSHKYTDPSGHIPLLLIGLALLVGAASAKAEFERQVREGDNYTNWLSIGVVGISNTLLCLIPGGKAVSAVQAAKAGGTFVFKTFALQFGKAIGLGVAAGFATDAGIEVARQLATGRNITNLNQDRIVEAGVVGGISGGAGAIFGASVELFADTRIGRSIVAKATEAFSKGKDAVKNQFAKIASKNGKAAVETVAKNGNSARLNTYGDALRESLGPAYKSHPEEYNAILSKANELGVSIEFRPGTLAYDMEFGKAGKLIIDPEASIGALRHEYTHMLDDFALGHPGMRIIADSDKFWELEYRGYVEELGLARKIKDYDAGRFIMKEMRQRRMEILGR